MLLSMFCPLSLSRGALWNSYPPFLNNFSATAAAPYHKEHLPRTNQAPCSATQDLSHQQPPIESRAICATFRRSPFNWIQLSRCLKTGLLPLWNRSVFWPSLVQCQWSSRDHLQLLSQSPPSGAAFHIPSRFLSQVPVYFSKFPSSLFSTPSALFRDAACYL